MPSDRAERLEPIVHYANREGEVEGDGGVELEFFECHWWRWNQHLA